MNSDDLSNYLVFGGIGAFWVYGFIKKLMKNDKLKSPAPQKTYKTSTAKTYSSLAEESRKPANVYRPPDNQTIQNSKSPSKICPGCGIVYDISWSICFGCGVGLVMESKTSKITKAKKSPPLRAQRSIESNQPRTDIKKSDLTREPVIRNSMALEDLFESPDRIVSAVIMKEILGPPVSERDASDDRIIIR